MPEIYVPILRNRGNERSVIQEFTRSTLPGSPEREIDMVPLVEVTDHTEIGNWEPYEDAGEFLMVELPQYLTERSNEYEEGVNGVLDQYGSPEEFYLEEAAAVPVPVISGSIDPVDYTEYLPSYRALEDEFDRIAVRLMIRGFSNPITGDQRTTLEELARAIRPDDVVLFDLVDNGTSDALEGVLQYLADLFDDNPTAILNAFDAYNGHPENRSPHMADDIGAAAFGDYGINQRFKPAGGGPPEEVRIRHYFPNRSRVEFFGGDDYQDAASELRDWNEWDRGHCDGCRQADRTTNNDPNTWAQIKMQHYFSSVLRGEL